MAKNQFAKVTSTPAPNRAPPAHTQWEKAPRTTLANEIVEQIISAVLSGKLKTGDFLGSEASLSEEFGVSRMATRDALRALDAYGVVQVRKGAGGGVRIAKGDANRFVTALAVQMRLLGVTEADAFEAQFAIESLTTELAATYATPGDLKTLSEIISRALQQVHDPVKWLDTIFEFHLALAAASHNDSLSILLRGLIMLLRGHYTRRTTPQRAIGATRHYASLVRALEARDKDQATSILRRQLTQVRDGLVSIIKKNRAVGKL